MPWRFCMLSGFGRLEINNEKVGIPLGIAIGLKKE
jgi:hypothetical protein